MATVNLGSIKFNWQGAYAGGTAYAVDDVVSYNGSSYICKLASTGNLPTNTTYWDQMSSAGTNGTDGTDLTTTLTTQGDIVYRDASGLARLGAGTSGQVLQTNGTGANPSWGTVSSDWVKISDGSFSASDLIFDNLDFTTYNSYKLFLSKVYATQNGSYFVLRYRYDNSGTQDTEVGSQYRFSLYGQFTGAGSGNGNEASGSGQTDRIRCNWELTPAANSGAVKAQDFEFHLNRWNNTTTNKNIGIKVYGTYDNGSEYTYFLDGMGLSRNSGRAYNGLRFFLNNSNEFACDYALYGIK